MKRSYRFEVGVQFADGEDIVWEYIPAESEEEASEIALAIWSGVESSARVVEVNQVDSKTVYKTWS